MSAKFFYGVSSLQTVDLFDKICYNTNGRLMTYPFSVDVS